MDTEPQRKRRRVISIAEKLKMIEEYDKKQNNLSEVADLFNISVSIHHSKRIDKDGSSISTRPTGSLEEKDAIVMNGLMYYFINHHQIKESNGQKTSFGNQAGAIKGEIGIINNPIGMPLGTIQITDFLLADLRHLLWGHANELGSNHAQVHSCTKCKQQFSSSSELQIHSKSHVSGESVGLVEEDKQCDFQKLSTIQSTSQVPDGEVGMFLLGDDVEVATAVVVINSEAEEKEMVLEVSS